MSKDEWRIRLDEAKWWIEYGSDREGDLSDIGRERLNFLEKG